MSRKISAQFLRPACLKTILLFWATMLCLCFSTQSSAQELKLFQRFFQASNSSGAAGQAFRAGRDLIGERKWADAAARFNDFIRAYPRDKNLDAALYWLAFCLKQQGKPQEANQTLERLLKEYPRSNWKDDARALRIELAEALNNLVAEKEALNVPSARPASSAQSAFPATAGNPESDREALERQQEMRERDKIARERDQLFRERDQIIRGGEQRTSDNDDPNAIKLVALQSLFQADPERALNIALGFLRADSKASPTFQEAALGLIARHGGERAWPVLTETARNQALAESVREQAFYWIAQQRPSQALDTLIHLYDAEKNQTLKERLMYWLAQSNSDPARTKINAIARSDANHTLRERAIYWIAQRGDAEANEALIRLFDDQETEGMKERVLYWLGQRGGKAALQKLFAVAKNDSSQRLREKAVYYLGQSNDPEALKLLEQIIK